MLVPIEVLEYDLKASGFSYKIPVNEHTFIGGRDDRIEDAPLGYYRFHYWINSDTSKPHENYVFIGKHAGFICISFMQENESRFRLLIRSAMGWKSIIILPQELEMYQNSISNTLVLREGLKRFCESIFPEEMITTAFDSGLSSPLNMISIGINSKEDESKDSRNVSRNSSLNSIKSSMTLSALRLSFAGSQESVSFSRFGSMASLSDALTGSFDEFEFNDEHKMNIIEDLTVNFFKKAYKIKDNSFVSNLLELEKPLTPKSFNFDVIDLSEYKGENFKKFQQSLGQEINRKETINYVTILAEKYKMADAISSSVSGKTESTTTSCKNNAKSPNSSKLDSIMAEFIETEKNYLQNLKLIDKIFISYLRNDDCGKFILKIKDFKDIFEGIVQFIPIHEKFVDNLIKDEGIDNFMSALTELTNSKNLYSYQSYFTTYEKRMESLKSCIGNYSKFAQYHDDCVNRIPELNKKGLDQLFISPIQRIPRYNLLIKEAIKYVTDESKYEILKTILDEISKVAQFLNTTKHKAEQTEKLFIMQRKVYDFPPDFLRAERIFLTKIACFMVDPIDGKISKTRYTIYLCNDMVIFAKKRSSISGHTTHDFILAINIKHIQVHSSRSKSAEKIYFTAEIDMEYSHFTNNLNILDSTLFSRKKRSILPSLNENGIVRTNFQFSPKTQKRLSGFINEFIEARNQFLLSESPAKLMFKQEEKWDIFFHTFDKKEQINSENRSQVLIVYVEDEVDLKDHFEFLSNYSAVAVVQGGRSSTFRFMVGTSNPQFSDADAPFFETGQDLVDICLFSKTFYKAILNTHLLISIYPPYSKTVIQQRRFVLESAVSASKSGSISCINKNSGIRGFFAGLTGNSDKSSSDKLSRGSSLKNGSSPLSSPSKLRAEELKREIQMESSMSLLHL